MRGSPSHSPAFPVPHTAGRGRGRCLRSCSASALTYVSISSPGAQTITATKAVGALTRLFAVWWWMTSPPGSQQAPPFSEHCARDFGGATLGSALLLGIAFVAPRAHFVFHVAHLGGATVAETVALTAADAAVALLGVAIILVVPARDRRGTRPGTPVAARRSR